MAEIRQGELALTTTETNEEKKQATGEHDVEDGQIKEETTEDDAQFNNLVKQLDGNSEEKSTVQKLNFVNFEEKEDEDEHERIHVFGGARDARYEETGLCKYARVEGFRYR